MTRITQLRTTSFRLLEGHFGRVHVYRAGPDFCRAWEGLAQRWQKLPHAKETGGVPYAGLALALRILTGDFVALQRRVARRAAVIVSRRPFDPTQLRLAFESWEVHALGMDDQPIVRVLGDLTHEALDVHTFIQRRPGKPPLIPDGESWVWDVALWSAVHQLAARAMDTDRGIIKFRADSDAALLSWDHLVETKGKQPCAAMHKITALLRTVPGVEEPVLSLQPSLVRLSTAWWGSRSAWVEMGLHSPILRAGIRHKPVGDGWQSIWSDRAIEVLKGATLHTLPTPDQPSFDGRLRTGFRKQPRYHDIGKGVGPWFYEYVARHAYACLGEEVVPLHLGTSRASWPSKERAAPRTTLFRRGRSTSDLPLLVVYANSDTRRRVRDALSFVLRDEHAHSDAERLLELSSKLESLADETTLRAGPLTVRFIRPPGADKWLLNRGDRNDIKEWLASWFGEELANFRAVLIETDSGMRDQRDALADPKHVLRGELARRGLVSQFISASSAPKRPTQESFTDYAAANAIGDLMRSAGFFLRPFPVLGAGKKTIVVGVYGTRLTKRTTNRGPGYVTNVVAVELGGHHAWGFADDHGWVPLRDATAWFLSTDHILTLEKAKERAQHAVAQLPVALNTTSAILLFDAIGCRRFWPCLADKSDGTPEPWMVTNGSAVVRVRAAANEVPRPAGVGEWREPAAAARFTDFRPMSVTGAQGVSAKFVVSGSAVMSQNRTSRTGTRFAVPVEALQDDWHALGTTELLVLEPGKWTQQELEDQTAMMCRVAPTWDRGLRWPSALHLARAVVRDHPHEYFMDHEDDEDDQSANGLIRLDLLG